MSYLKLVCAVLIGFALGAFMLHTRSVKATGGLVYVEKADIGGSTLIRGTDVVGLSCVGSESDTKCYVATR